MKRIACIVFFFILKTIVVNGQTDDIDSLQNLLKRTTNDTARIGLYVQLTYAAEDTSTVYYSDTAISIINGLLPKANSKTRHALHYYFADALYFRSMYFANNEAYDTALHYLKEALTHVTVTKDKLQEARILNDMGVCYFHKNDKIKSIDLVTKSLVIREGLHDDEQLRNAYNNVAFIYKETGLINQSLDLNFKALELAEKRKNRREIALSYNNIGALYHKFLMDREKAMEYYKKSLAITEKDGDKKAASLAKNNIGAVYAEAGNYKEAILWQQESLATRREINYKFGIINTLSSLGYNYTRIGAYDRARASLAEAMLMNADLNDKVLQTSIHRFYAELYNTLDKTDSALYHAILSHKINLELGNPLNISGSAAMLSDLNEKKGNFQEALIFYKLHKKMQDSISNDDLKKEGIKSNIEYEYLKKKVDADKEHGRQLDKRNVYAWLLLALLVLSLVLAYGFYKRYKLRQRLKEVEMRNKIAADLHDDVGSTLSSIRMYSNIVKQQPNHTNTSLKLLDRIYDNSKETIENMSDIVWMIKPGNDEFSNIEGRMLNFANELCTPAGINFEFSKNEMLNTVKIPMEQRRDIYLIFKEAINNAVKYAHCHSIRTSIVLEKNVLKMTISDDGTGFSTEEIKHGNGLSNMKKRALTHSGSCTINSKEGEGTEIQIHFSL